MSELPIVYFESQAAWEAWLEDQYAESQGVWLKIAKKGSSQESVSYAEALDVALCFGWIDGQKGKLDESFWLQRFTPRRARSPWSKINREKAEALIAAGKMREAGLREVERAREDGRWDAAYASQSTATVPEDLQAALDANPAAAAFFETLNSANRYAVLYRVGSAKRSETRQKRIAQYVAMLAEGRKIHE